MLPFTCVVVDCTFLDLRGIGNVQLLWDGLRSQQDLLETCATSPCQYLSSLPESAF